MLSVSSHSPSFHSHPYSSSNRDDVLQFLDSLDNYSPQSSTGGAPSKSSLPRSTSNSTLPSSSLPSTTATPPPKNAKEAQSVLDFLDEITATTSSGGGAAPPSSSSRTSIDQSTRRTTPSTTGIGRTTSRSNISQVAAGQSPVAGAGRKSTESVRSTRSLVNQPSTSTPTSHSNERNSPVPTSRAIPSQLNTPTRPTSTLPEPSQPSPSPSPAPAQPQQSGGWGWSSVWSTASTAINQASALAQQARTAAEEQVKHAAQQAQSGGGFPGEGLMKAAWGTEEEGGVAKKWTEGMQGLVKNANLEHLGKQRFRQSSRRGFIREP